MEIHDLSDFSDSGILLSHFLGNASDIHWSLFEEIPVQSQVRKQKSSTPDSETRCFHERIDTTNTTEIINCETRNFVDEN